MNTTIGLFRRVRGGLLLAVALLSAAGNLQATPPSWWAARGVTITGQAASDFSMANQGQAKWFASKAEEEMRARLPAGYNDPIYTTPLPSGDNYLPINQGQLKNLVQPLYDRLQQFINSLPDGAEKDVFLAARPQGISGGTYPWTDTTADDSSYAPVNLGQLKYVLSFNLPAGQTVTVTATDPIASEDGPDTGTFTVTRVGVDLSAALTVNFQLTGTATEGTDYQTIGSQVTIQPNESSATVTVTPIPDPQPEGTESVILTLAASTDYVIGNPGNATVQIMDHLPRVVYYGPTSGGLEATTPNVAPVGTGQYDSQIWTPGDSNPALDWNTKTTADFAAFDAIVFGDEPACDFGGNANIWDAAIANRDVWSAAVLGNVIILGTDPDYHSKDLLIHQAVTFAVSSQSRQTGLYVALGCYYESVVPAPTAVNVEMLRSLGTFKVVEVQDSDCPNVVQKLADHPALASVDDAYLSGWNCSAHEGFQQWPASFDALAIITDVAPRVYTPGYQGLVYILARGATTICPELAGGSFDGSGLFGFTIQGKVGDNIVINASTDGENWQQISTVTLGATTQTFTDQNSASYTHRYYRANLGACCSTAIGYIKKTVPAHVASHTEGEALLANQLDAPPNTLNSLFPTMPDGTKIRKWDIASQAWTDATFHTASGWDYPNWTLAPGEGAMIKNPLSTPMTVAFIGTLVEGSLVSDMPVAKSLQASQVPEAGAVDFLGIMTGLQSGATVYKFNVGSQIYDASTWNGTAWSPSVPTVDVAESFFVVNSADGNWSRLYSTCCEMPRITAQPTDQFACTGGSVTFSVQAVGPSSLQYQWNHNDVAISGANSPTLTINPVSTSDAGNYSVTITACSPVTSREAVLSVDVTANDDSASAFEADPTTIFVENNDPDPTLPITAVTQGANGGTVQISGDSKSVIYTSVAGYVGTDTFTYTVTHGACSATATVTVTVNDRAPVITTQPQNQVADAGTTATFSVAATGYGTLSYQWIHGGNVVGTAPDLTLNNVQAADMGDYYVLISNGYGSVSSDHVTLSINGLPPSAQILSPADGDNISGTVTVTADGMASSGTVKATLWVDGQWVTAKKFSSPYAFDCDTTALANGDHQFLVKVYDINDNEGVSTPVTVHVNNFISNCRMSAAALIPDGDDVTAQTITLQADLGAACDWTITVSSSDGTPVTSFSGTGNQVLQTWDGTGSTGVDDYSFDLAATPPGQPAGSPVPHARRPARLLGRAPDWDSLNNINYHAYAGDLDNTGLKAWLTTYFFTYATFMGPLFVFPIPADVYTYENRIWETTFGYDGDEVVDYTVTDFLGNVGSDNVVYMMCHGIGAADDPDTWIVASGPKGADGNYPHFNGVDVALALHHSARGCMFVQINACNSASYLDAVGNNDIATGFGIMNSPMTWRRAYLGWGDRYDGSLPWPFSHFGGEVLEGPAELYTFDQQFWENLSNGYSVQDAVSAAYAQILQPFAVPIVIGDGSLVLPQLF